MVGSEESEIIRGTLEAVKAHDLPHEILTAQEIRARFPVLTPGEDMMGVFETEAGYLIPEACLEAHFQMAEQHGAALCFEESLVSWNVLTRKEEGGGDDEELISVVTDRNNTYITRKLVLSVGAWAPEVYGGLIPVSLHAERRALFWFQPCDDDDDAGGGGDGGGGGGGGGGVEAFRNMPVFLWDASSEGDVCQFYGFPPERSGPLSHAIKIARHQAIGSTLTSDEPPSAVCTPDSIDRHVCPTEVSAMQQVLEGRVPVLAGSSRVEAVDTCLYTLTEDENL
jgi:sarcosine oxidase